MRTTLELDDDVLAAAREMAAASGRSLGSAVSDLLRKGLMPAAVATEGDLPVIHVPAGTPPITPAMVRRAFDD